MQTFAYDFAATFYKDTSIFCYLALNTLNKSAKYEEN